MDTPDDDRAERSRQRSNLAIGAPLTAAFVGGALIFESQADIGELLSDDQDAGAAVAAEAEALIALEDAEGSRSLSFQTDTDPSSAASDASNSTVEDLAPASSDDQQQPIAGNEAQLASAQSPPAGAAHQGQTSQPASDGGSEVGLNFFNIDVEGDGAPDDALEADPYVEKEILSRKTIVGTPGDDVLEGTDGHDRIIGASGDDVIFGRAGNDILNGNDGNDELHGGTGRDRLFGGSGNDFLEGGNDNDLDLLRGGSGDDILIVNGAGDLALERFNDRGEDLQIVRDGYAAERGTSAEGTTFIFADQVGRPLPGGVAAHTQSMSPGIENLSFQGVVDYDVVADDYDNRLTGNDGDNRIHAGGGDDILAGGSGSDHLIGGDGSDELNGGAGNDRLLGGDDDDLLRGGAGDDVLIGGLGSDELYGEAGDDSYVLGLNDVAIDSIFDHEGANRLVLEDVGSEVIEASLLGNDLYVTADRTPIAVVNDYVGNESSLAGIDFGQGLKSVDSLLVDNPDLESGLDAIEAERAETIANDPLRAHDDLSAPTQIDSDGDNRERGTEGDDWLSGLDGDDHLFGNGGHDILEGGSGGDHLNGGAGNDRYLFKANDSGPADRIYDTDGQNFAELQGFGRHEPEAGVLGNGQDLGVFANDELIFIVKDFVGNEDSFIGVQSGERFFETDDLLA